MLTDEELDEIERLAGWLKSDGIWSMDISTSDALALIAEVRHLRAANDRLTKALANINPQPRQGGLGWPSGYREVVDDFNDTRTETDAIVEAHVA